MLVQKYRLGKNKLDVKPVDFGTLKTAIFRVVSLRVQYTSSVRAHSYLGNSRKLPKPFHRFLKM